MTKSVISGVGGTADTTGKSTTQAIRAVARAEAIQAIRAVARAEAIQVIRAVAKVEAIRAVARVEAIRAVARVEAIIRAAAKVEATIRAAAKVEAAATTKPAFRFQVARVFSILQRPHLDLKQGSDRCSVNQRARMWNTTRFTHIRVLRLFLCGSFHEELNLVPVKPLFAVLTANCTDEEVPGYCTEGNGYDTSAEGFHSQSRQ